MKKLIIALAATAGVLNGFAETVFVQDREVFVHEANYDTSKIPPYDRSQNHGINAYDWMWMMDFADRVLGK